MAARRPCPISSRSRVRRVTPAASGACGVSVVGLDLDVAVDRPNVAFTYEGVQSPESQYLTLWRMTLGGAVMENDEQAVHFSLMISMVGVTGFEPATPTSRTRLSYTVRAITMRASPIRKLPNIAASSVDVPSGAVRNSFQMNTPQIAATIVAPWPSP
jgi:hypothetical protein